MHDSWAISRLIAQIKGNWRRGEALPDASAALEANPHLRRWKSIVLDLAAEEYHLRAREGQAVDPDDFCRRFPDYQRSLLHRLEVEQFLREDGEQPPQPWPEPGDVFLGYRLVEPLGRGAVGRVFLAQQIELRDRLVVVKITPRGRHEADTLAILNHSYIVPVYDYREDPATGLAAICMPFLSRTTLDDFLAAAQPRRDFRVILSEMRRRFPMEDAPGAEALGAGQLPPRSFDDAVLNLGRQMAEALAHTHRRSVLHLDLKPSNVLLLPDGRPMLLDFNLSLEGPIGASVIGGTLPYMSPEQLQEAVLGRSYRSRPVDARSDVFSLGVMLYELLAGSHPFGEIPRRRDSREAAKELLRRHEAGPASLLELRPHLDRQVALFLESCLAFHPDQRPGTADEAAEALRRFLAPRGRLARWLRSHRKSVAAAGALVVAAVVSAGAVWATLPPIHERHLQAAETAVAAGNWTSAEASLQESISANADFVQAWELLGRVHREQGEYREAAECFDRAWKLSNDAKFLAEMGHVWYEAKNLEAAAGFHRMASDRGFASVDLYLELGDFYRGKRQFEEAAECFDKAAKLAPSLSATYEQARNEMEWSLNTANHEPRPDVLAAIREPAEEDGDAKMLFCAASLHALAPSAENDEVVRRLLHQAVKRSPDRRELYARQFHRFRGEDWFRELLPE